jgi:hypothetical protein
MDSSAIGIRNPPSGAFCGRPGWNLLHLSIKMRRYVIPFLDEKQRKQQ